MNDAFGQTTRVVTVAGMVAMAFCSRGGLGRRVLSPVVIGGLCSTTAVAAAHRWGVARTALALGATTAATGAIEHLGSTTGLPFGKYEYTPKLQPQIAGVPAVVPAAWFAMAVPARETAHAALGARSNIVSRVLAGAAALTAWDLFLDPQMVGEGYWTWSRHGAYRGIPVSNFVGWFATSIGVMALLEVVLPAGDNSLALVGEYGVMAIMETVGFATFFGDRVVAAAGGSAMLSVVMIAGARMGGLFGTTGA